MVEISEGVVPKKLKLALKDLPENNQIILKESDMSGVFNFASSIQKQLLLLTIAQQEQQKKSRWPITNSNYFPTILYHFDELNDTPDYVRIEVSQSFISDFLSGDYSLNHRIWFCIANT